MKLVRSLPDIHRLSPNFIAECEIDLGLTYALRRPKLAKEAFTRALDEGKAAHRPDIVDRANTLLAALAA